MSTIAITVLLTERFEEPKIWKLEIPAATPEDAATKVMHLSNAPHGILSHQEREILVRHSRAGLRSVSVGDTLIIQDAENPDKRHIATVDRIGFKFH